LLYVGFALSSLIFNFALEYHITVVEENLERFDIELDTAFVCAADDINQPY